MKELLIEPAMTTPGTPLSVVEIETIRRKERGIPQALEMARVLDSHELLRQRVAVLERLRREFLSLIDKKIAVVGDGEATVEGEDTNLALDALRDLHTDVEQLV